MIPYTHTYHTKLICYSTVSLMDVHLSKKSRHSPSHPILFSSSSSSSTPLAIQLLLSNQIYPPQPQPQPALIHNNITSLKSLFDSNQFRTNVVISPRSALSIYKDSFVDSFSPSSTTISTRAFLQFTFGLHPSQSAIEQFYKTNVKQTYTFSLLVKRLKFLLSSDPPSLSILTSTTALQPSLSTLISSLTLANPTIQPSQITSEHSRIVCQNSTFANACMQLFLVHNVTTIKEIMLKSSPDTPQYERITITLYDSELDTLKPDPFTFLPSLSLALSSSSSLQNLLDALLETFWSSLLSHSYFATPALIHQLTPELTKFLQSGLTQNPLLPLLLNAHFSPTYPLAFYLHGLAGAGKSSFVRAFIPALNETIEENLDPELLVRYVKQNLNKPFCDLNLELTLRPNNNDLSVMSIIQGR